MHSTVLRIVVAVAILLSPRAWAAPDDPVADPAAEKAFAEFVAAYRALPAVKVKTTVAVGAGEHGAESKGQPVEAELVHGVVGGKPDGARKGVFKLRGYTIWIGDGQIAAVHESNPDTYLRTPDGGSPFYALLSAFVDLPFPDLALAFGETDPTELVMQLNPKAPNVVPTAVVNEQVEGKERRTFKLTAEHESIDLVVDPATNLPQSMVVRITGGTLVPAGATLTYTHTFSYEIPKAPLAEADFAFDPGKRQKVDLMPALVKRPEPGAAGENGEPRHALVGKPLPPLLLPLLDDGVLDTAKMKGRVLVLDFWATWCGPCKAALPSLHQIAADFRRQDAPVSFYTVNVFEQEKQLDKRRELIGDFWKAQKHTLPVALDLDGAAGKAFEIPGIPMTVVVRSDGIVHSVHVGFRSEQLVADVKGAIEALEAKDAAKPGSPRQDGAGDDGKAGEPGTKDGAAKDAKGANGANGAAR